MAFAQRVFAALDQAGVPFIVLKGAALIACYLADRSLRPMDDIDILVPEDRLADAIAVLTAMNLHPEGISLRDLMLNSRESVHRMVVCWARAKYRPALEGFALGP